MIVVTENWSKRTLALTWPWRATREFMVTGAADETEALTATGIPQRGDGHPYNTTRLTCDGPAITEVRGGGVAYIVTCSYTVTDLDDKGDGKEADPLQEPVKIRWSSVIEGKESDFDLDNRPILDSAGNSAGTMDLPVRMKRLQITKNFPLYDINLSEKYENAVNSAAVNFAGVITAAVQHMKCETIEPAVEYTPDAPYIPIVFTFLVIFDPILGTYPFQDRRLDAGRNGWYGTGTNKAAAKFTSKAKPDEPLDIDIRLDGTGLPLTKPYANSGTGLIAVGGTNAAVIPPNPTSVYAREYYDSNGSIQAGLNSATVAVFNYFKRSRIVDFTPLLALL